MIVFTNVPFTSFLREVMSEAGNYALIRRFVEILWDTEPISLVPRYLVFNASAPY
jgi:hypothetical protein